MIEEYEYVAVTDLQRAKIASRDRVFQVSTVPGGFGHCFCLAKTLAEFLKVLLLGLGPMIAVPECSGVP